MKVAEDLNILRNVFKNYQINQTLPKLYVILKDSSRFLSMGSVDRQRDQGRLKATAAFEDSFLSLWLE